jgi:hypothetical protein
MDEKDNKQIGKTIERWKQMICLKKGLYKTISVVCI